MRTRILVAALALIAPWEAHTSGSSTVRALGAHLEVSETSVRKIFAGGQGESAWHADWQATHQAGVDTALVVLAPVLDAVARDTGLTLAPYAEDGPVAWSWAEASSERSPAVVCVSGCRVLLRPWEAATGAAVPMFEVHVALAAPPPEGALQRLNEALAQALAQPEPDPP